LRPAFLTLLLLASPLLATNQPVATILGYHEVVPGGVPPFKTHPPPGMPDVPTEADRYTLSLESFTDELNYLDQNGYHVIALADLVDYLNGRRDELPPKAVVITVDDGYLSAYRFIFPLMRERKMPFTLFIYPQIVSLGKNYVTWQQVEEMADAGVDIESHTFTHPLLTRSKHPEMTADEYSAFLKHEMLDSKTEIEAHTGKPARFIAYPYSDVDSTVEQAATSYGYEAGTYDRVSGELITKKSRPISLMRFAVEHATTLDDFKRFLLP
jgi:peptidoglycan/xylan/chitin deacetylase (PgdA/CDA1 family)